MSVVERLLRYCKVDTQSDPESASSPSTKKQFDLAYILAEELKGLGVADAYCDAYCGVYGHLESNVPYATKTVGFIAHMDTAPDYSGTNVNPRVIQEYDGNDIVLSEGVILSPEAFPYLKSAKGKTVMVTDGSTLLGADDKAGIAAIMDAVEYLTTHPEVKHGRISIAFTPDEEVGRGTEHFDYSAFGADYAYTMDGGEIDVYSDETFNAAEAVVECTGFSIHPGSAKDKMINALNIAIEFQNMMPPHLRPEHTTGREPFIHLHNLDGDVEHAKMTYIVRAHEWRDFEHLQEVMKEAADYINTKHGTHVIDLTLREQYRNMKEVLKEYPEVSETAVQALKNIGLNPRNESIRGGTDGSSLTLNGLPCPNLGTGGQNYHGRYEYCVMEETELAVKLILEIIRLTAEVNA